MVTVVLPKAAAARLYRDFLAKRNSSALLFAGRTWVDDVVDGLELAFGLTTPRPEVARVYAEGADRLRARSCEGGCDFNNATRFCSKCGLPEKMSAPTGGKA